MTGAFKGAVRSFYSGTYYGELARIQRGIGMKLILTLTLLMAGIFFALLFVEGGYSELREVLAKVPVLAQSLPAVTLKNGALTIDKPMPYRINIGSDSDNAWVIIDTNYKVTDVNALEQYMRTNKVFVLLTRDKMVSRDLHKPRGKNMRLEDAIQISDLKDMESFSITHDDWRLMAGVISGWGMPSLLSIAFIGLFIGLFIVNFVCTFFTGIAVIILGTITRAGFEFAAAMRLAAAARIPVNVLSVVPVLVGRNIGGLTEWVLWGIYLVFAVWAVKLHSSTPAR